MNPSKETSQKESSFRLSKSIETLRDQAQVQANLAGREAKDAWQELEGWLQKIQRRVGVELEHAREKGELQTHLAHLEANDHLMATREAIKSVVSDLKGAANTSKAKAETTWDRARIQTHLAGLDLKSSRDALEKKLAKTDAKKFVSDGLASSADWIDEQVARLKGTSK